MNKEQLNYEILIQSQNVQCGAKLAAEIHYMFKEREDNRADDIFVIEEILKHFPELKYMINYHSEKRARVDGHKSVYIYKHEATKKVIDSIDSVKEMDSVLYHFASGKLFGYSDHEVMNFINKNCK